MVPGHIFLSSTLLVFCSYTATEGSSNQNELKQLAKEALQTPNTTQNLSPFDISVIRIFQEDSDLASTLHGYIPEDYRSGQRKFVFSDYDSWSKIVNLCFLRFSQIDSNEVQRVVKELLIPQSYLLFPQIADRFDMVQYKRSKVKLGAFIDAIFRQLFKEQMTVILAGADLAECNDRFRILIGDYQPYTYWKGSLVKYACLFLEKAGLERVKSAAYPLFSESQYKHHDLYLFAANLYEQIASENLRQAQEMLKSLHPDIYEQVPEPRQYWEVVKFYIKFQVM